MGLTYRKPSGKIKWLLSIIFLCLSIGLPILAVEMWSTEGGKKGEGDYDYNWKTRKLEYATAVNTTEEK